MRPIERWTSTPRSPSVHRLAYVDLAAAKIVSRFPVSPFAGTRFDGRGRLGWYGLLAMHLGDFAAGQPAQRAGPRTGAGLLDRQTWEAQAYLAGATLRAADRSPAW